MPDAVTVSESYQLILQRLDSHAQDTKRIESKIDRTCETVDEMRAESSLHHEELTRLFHEHDKTLDRHDLRICAAEGRVEHLDSDFSELAKNTGKFKIAGLQAQITSEMDRRKELEAGKRHWIRWVVATCAGVVIAIVGALLGVKLGGG